MKIRNLPVPFISLILLISCSSNAGSAGLVPSIVGDPTSLTPTSVPSPMFQETPVPFGSGDIAVDINSARSIASGLEIEVCYTTPDDADWRPMPGHLFYGAYEVFPDEIEFLPNEKFADKTDMGLRCALIRYRIDDPGTLAIPATFSILNLYTAGREMYGPCEEFQQRLSTHAKATTHRLQATCSEADDGTIAVTLTRHDPSITAEQASNLLNEIAKGEIIGPWEFTIMEIDK